MTLGGLHVAGSGAVFTWGCGEHGRLGIGTEANATTPQKVTAFPSVPETEPSISALPGDSREVPVHVSMVCCGVDHTLFLSVCRACRTCGHTSGCTSDHLGVHA